MPPVRKHGRKVNSMTSISKFDSEIYSEELYNFTESEFDEVQRLMADEGYHDFSIKLEQELDEQEAWKGSEQVSGILIKKACEHTSCPHTRCQREIRLGGIAI